MESKIEKAKNYHHYINDIYLSISDDEVSSNCFSGNPNKYYKFLEFPPDRSSNDLKQIKKLIEAKRKERLFLRTDPPERSPRKDSRSPTNPSIKTFSTRKKNAPLMKHLTVLIPEDGLKIKNEISQISLKQKNDKFYWETVWDLLLQNFEGTSEKKTRRIRSQSFDEYLCFSEKFKHFQNYLLILKKMKGKITLDLIETLQTMPLNNAEERVFEKIILKEIVKSIIVFIETPVLSLQVKCQELLDINEKNEKALLDRISSSMNLPSSPPNMISSVSYLNAVPGSSRLKMTNHQTSPYEFGSASLRIKRRTSFSNESKMKLYNLSNMPMAPQTTTNKALALKDYLPLLKSEKRNSVISLDNFQEDSILNENSKRKGSIPLFSPKVKSRASKFKDLSNVNITQKNECQRYFEISKVLRILRYCFSKIVYLFYYHDVAHSFIHGDFSAYKKTPNKSCKKYSDNNLEFNKNFNNLFRDEERSPLHPDKKINFNLFHQESKNLRNMKIFLFSLKIQLKECSDSYKSIFSKISDNLIEESDVQREKQNKYLSNYFMYKLKKWNVISKREGTKSLKASFLKSYDNEQIICKICAKTVLAKTIKDHSSICMKLTETKMDVKKIVETINGNFLSALAKYRRTFHIQNMVMKNQIKKTQKALNNAKSAVYEQTDLSHKDPKSNELNNEKGLLLEKEKSEEFLKPSKYYNNEFPQYSDDEIKYGDSKIIIKIPNYKNRKSLVQETLLSLNNTPKASANKLKKCLSCENMHFIMENKQKKSNKLNLKPRISHDNESNSEDDEEELSDGNDIEADARLKKIKNTFENHIFIEMKIPKKSSIFLSSNMRKSILPERRESGLLNKREMNEIDKGFKIIKNSQSIKENKNIIKLCDLLKFLCLIFIKSSSGLEMPNFKKLKTISQQTFKKIDSIYNKLDQHKYAAFNSKIKEIHLSLNNLNEQLIILWDLEKKLISINILSPPSSLIKHQSKFSRYRDSNHFSIGNFDAQLESNKEIVSPKSQKPMQKSALKTSNKKLHESRLEESSTFNFDLQKVSSKNLDDQDMTDLDGQGKNLWKASSRNITSIKNSSEDIPNPCIRRQSSISKSLRLSYINSRKKSFLASKETKNPTEEEQCVSQRKLLFRQRRSTFVEENIKNIDKSTNILLEEKHAKNQFVKNIFEVNISYELFNCGQTRGYSDGETKNVNSKSKGKIFKTFLEKDNTNEEDDEDVDMFLSDNCLDRVYFNHNLKIESQFLSSDDIHITIRDFDFLKLISKGAYGRVWLVKRTKTGDIYAMKIVNFAEKMSKNHLDSLKKENQVFKLVDGDFVVKAVFTFTYETYICFVMEYMLGGDLGSILEKYGRFDEEIAKFYLAEIILAVKNLHSKNIIHRDLKPDNILLDSEGHIKLTDFGLSDIGFVIQNKKKQQELGDIIQIRNKIDEHNTSIQSISNSGHVANLTKSKSKFSRSSETNNQKENFNFNFYQKKNTPPINHFTFKFDNKNMEDSFTAPSLILSPNVSKKESIKRMSKSHKIVGTPDYMAPEVIAGEGLQNSVVDWWSIGIILFEMLVGRPPFNDDTVEKTFENIKNQKIPWDELPIGYEEDCITPEAKDLIDKLLDKNYKTRLGVKGFDEIKIHKFFNGVDWVNIRKKDAPIKPVVKDNQDVSNFEKGKIYEENEKIDPFFAGGEGSGNKKIKQAKQMLNNDLISLNRFDILDEVNRKNAEELEETKLKTLEQFNKEEEEIKNEAKEFSDDDLSSDDI